MTETRRLAIVGAGIGGATLAGYLARWTGVGVHVTLIDRRPVPEGPDGGAIVLTGEALEILRELGVELPNGCAARPGDEDVSRQGGDDRSEVGNLSVDYPLEPQVTILRDALLCLLLQSSRAQVNAQFNTEVVAVRETPSGVELEHRPLLTWQDGDWIRNPGSKASTSVYDAVIGADGNAPASCVAKCILGPESARATVMPMLAMQALVPQCSDAVVQATSFEGQPSPAEREYLQGIRGQVGRLELGACIGLTVPAPVHGEDPVAPRLGRWAFCTIMIQLRDPFNSFPKPEIWANTMRKYIKMSRNEELRDRALLLVDRASASPGVPHAGKLHAWVPFRKTQETWMSQGGRIVLLGDASHLMPPTMGHASACAMGDARRLSEELRQAPLTTDGWAAAFVEYVRARQDVAASRVEDSLKEAAFVTGRTRGF